MAAKKKVRYVVVTEHSDADGVELLAQDTIYDDEATALADIKDFVTQDAKEGASPKYYIAQLVKEVAQKPPEVIVKKL